MIERLDAADGDADFEDNGDLEPDNDNEPSLGWAAALNQTRALKQCHDDCHGDGAWADCELGSLDGEIDQSRWAGGDRHDVEADYVRFFHGHFAGGTPADCETDWHSVREV